MYIIFRYPSLSSKMLANFRAKVYSPTNRWHWSESSALFTGERGKTGAVIRVDLTARPSHVVRFPEDRLLGAFQKTARSALTQCWRSVVDIASKAESMIDANIAPLLSSDSGKRDETLEADASMEPIKEANRVTQDTPGYAPENEELGNRSGVPHGSDADLPIGRVNSIKDESVNGIDERADSSSEDYIGLSAKIFGLDFTTVSICPLANYSFGKKEVESQGQEARGASLDEIRNHREMRYQERGMRRSVAAILLVHSHNFPHVLLLQRTTGNGGYALPGGRLRPGESAEDGLRRKLTAKLSPVHSVTDAPVWDVGEQGKLRNLSTDSIVIIENRSVGPCVQWKRY
jgi:hypothetical protein